MNYKAIDSLTIEDLVRHPVWQFSHEPDVPDTHVKPVRRVPVSTLDGRIVGTQVVLADGSTEWVLLGNIDTRSAKTTSVFLELSVEHGGRWFHLARYFDFDYAKRGPAALASFLEKEVSHVFPIRYDVRSIASGDPNALAGEIVDVPRNRLSDEEITKLAVWRE